MSWTETRLRLRADRSRLQAVLSEFGGDAPGGLCWRPSYVCVLLYRISRYFFTNGHTLWARLFWELNLFLTGADIAAASDLEEGLVILGPSGSAIAGKAGRNLTVMPCAGIGGELGRWQDAGAGPGLPVLGVDVILEPHAGVLGPVRVGDRVRIEAGVVITRDIVSDVIVEAPKPRVFHRWDLA